MTYREAFRANMRPYMLPHDSVEFLLTEQGLSQDDEYVADEENRKSLFTAVVNGLSQVISLKEEKDTGSTQTYDVEAVKIRIRILCRRYGIDNPLEEGEQFVDRTNEW